MAVIGHGLYSNKIICASLNDFEELSHHLFNRDIA